MEDMDSTFLDFYVSMFKFSTERYSSFCSSLSLSVSPALSFRLSEEMYQNVDTLRIVDLTPHPRSNAVLQI
jgi:hypothetical protein